MALVTVQVNGRSYTVACDEGEEEHLADLARYIDGKVQDLARTVGQVGDARLMLMAGLLISDELSDALGRVAELEAEIAQIKQGRSQIVDQAQKAQAAVAQLLENAARRIDDIAGRLPAS